MNDCNLESGKGCGCPAKRFAWLFALAFVIVCVLAIKETRHYFLPKRFAVVEPGHLYRSGYCEPRPLRQIIDENGIKTILTLLNDEPGTPMQTKEEAVAKEKGVAILRIPMPGDGRGELDQLDEAADLLNNEQYHPMLVHCAAGVNRTGAVYAAWRMKYCGWSLERALEEAKANGYSEWDNPELREHIELYYQHRILSTQPASDSIDY